MSLFKLDLQDQQFGPNYDPDKLRRLQSHLNAVTSFNQKLAQMLRAGEDGQVLTKVGHPDLVAKWADAAGGHDCCITLEEGEIIGGGPGGTYVPISFSDDFVIIDGVVHLSGSGGGGTVVSVNQGFGILVNSTDPTAPIISLDQAVVPVWTGHHTFMAGLSTHGIVSFTDGVEQADIVFAAPDATSDKELQVFGGAWTIDFDSSEPTRGVRFGGTYLALESADISMQLNAAQVGCRVVVAGITERGNAILAVEAPPTPDYIENVTNSSDVIIYAGGALPSAWVDVCDLLTITQDIDPDEATVFFELLVENTGSKDGVFEIGISLNGAAPTPPNSIQYALSAGIQQIFANTSINAAFLPNGTTARLQARGISGHGSGFSVVARNSVRPSRLKVSVVGTGGGAIGGNPTSTVGLTVVNGTALTWMRSDAAPPLDVAIAPTWSALHTFNLTPVVPNDSWAYAKIQNVSTNNRVLGRITAGAGDIEELTAANLITIIGPSLAANPTGTVGLTVVNGVATTFMRSDAAPPLSQSIAPTWTGQHKFMTNTFFGTTTSLSVGNTAFVQQFGGTIQGASHTIVIGSADAVGPRLGFGKTRSLTYDGLTPVQSGDILGQIAFFGADGTTISNAGVQLTAYVSGTVATNVMPGELRLTITSAAGAQTERFRFSNFGGIGIAGANYGTAGQTLTSGGAAGVVSWSNPALVAANFANPTGTIGLTAVNGSAITAMRSDGAPPLSQAIIPTWTGAHTFNGAVNFASLFKASGVEGLEGQVWASQGVGLPPIWRTAGSGSIDLTFRFNNSTAGTDPGNTGFALNTASYATVTSIAFDTLTVGGFDASTILSLLRNGNRIYIQQTNDANRAAVFEVTAVATDHTGWWSVPVTFINTTVAGTLFANNAACTAVFILSSSSTALANPTATIGLTVVNGAASTGMRSDAAPPLSQAIVPTWSALHTFSLTPVVPNDSWTYAKIQNVSATSRFLGRITAGAGDIEELTGTQSTTLLDVFTSTLKGLAPLSGGGTTNFLRADGTWAAPGGSSVTPAALTKTDDTNVTLTLGGTPATALLQASSITVGWAGTLAVPRGGSGAATLTGYLKGNGTAAFTAVATIPYTDISSPPTIPVGANPSATIGLTVVNGSATTFMRSDGAPPLSQAIVPTWTGMHTFTNANTLFGATAAVSVGNVMQVQQFGNTLALSGHSMVKGGADANGVILALGKTRSTTYVATAPLVLDDVIGVLAFYGADGSTFNSSAGGIYARVAGTVSTGIVPGELHFYLTNTAGSGVDRFRMGSFGGFGIGAAGDYGTAGQSFTSGGGAAPPTWSNPALVAANFANPSATIGLTVINGSAVTAMRSDAAPPLSQAIVPTWSGLHTFAVGGESIRIKSSSGYISWYNDSGGTRSSYIQSIAGGTMYFVGDSCTAQVFQTANVQRLQIDANAVQSSMQIRAVGWYTSPGTVGGPAVEIGSDGTVALVLGYNRNASAYVPMRIVGSVVTIENPDGSNFRYAGGGGFVLRGASASQATNVAYLSFQTSAGVEYGYVGDGGSGDGNITLSATNNLQFYANGVNVLNVGLISGSREWNFKGTTNITYFFYSTNEDIYLRPGKSAGQINMDTGVAVSISIPFISSYTATFTGSGGTSITSTASSTSYYAANLYSAGTATSGGGNTCLRLASSAGARAVNLVFTDGVTWNTWIEATSIGDLIFSVTGTGSFGEKMKLTTTTLNLGTKRAIDFSDGWLRLNQSNDFTSGTYSPYLIRSDSHLEAPYLSESGGTGKKLYPNTGGMSYGTVYVNGATGTYHGYAINDGSLSPCFMADGSSVAGIYIQGDAKWLLYRSGASAAISGYGITAVSFTASSSRKLKRETGVPQNAADILKKLRPILYRMLAGDDREQLGLIAEEVHEVCPQLSDGETVAYDRLAILLLAAWQDEHELDQAA